MRKFKKLASLSMAIGLLFSAGGCAFANNSSGQQLQDSNKNAPVILYDFEDWKPTFHLIRTSSFGSITRSADYVKSGQYSAKLVPGGNTSGGNPTFSLPLNSTVWDFSYNVLDYRSMSVSFYNAGQEDVDVMIQLGDITKTFTLNPGWNDIEYMIEHNFLNIFVDYFEDIDTIKFSFKNNPECIYGDLSKSAVVYIDDITLNPVLKPVELVDIVTDKKFEILDFEELYQGYVMKYDSYDKNLIPGSKVLDYRKGEFPEGAYPSHGNRSLEITLQPGDGVQDQYPYIIIPQNIVKNACSLLTQEELENAWICYDVYNISYSGIMDHQWGNKTVWGGGVATGKWTTYRYKLSDCINLETDKLSNGCKVALITCERGVGQEEKMLLDNVRFEIIAE